MIDHYTSLGLDWRARPLGSPTATPLESALEIDQWVKEKGGKCWFGIGTSMSNDFGPDSPAVDRHQALRGDHRGWHRHPGRLSGQSGEASWRPDAVRVAM